VDSVEKPLHVRVAEALGFRVRDDSEYGCRRQCVGNPYAGSAFPSAKQAHNHIRWSYFRPYLYEPSDGDWTPVEHYDTDWSATGPLIEKYRIAMWTAGPVGELLGDGHDRWRCNSDDNGLQLEGSQVGPTPLIAVCNLILALHEAGKLPK
jgi:hypothetical protein